MSTGLSQRRIGGGACPFNANGGIPLTQGTTICSVLAGGRFSPDARRVRGTLYQRRRLSRVPGGDALARRIPVADLRSDEGVAGADAADPVPLLRRLWTADLGHRGHDLSGHAVAAAHVVRSHVPLSRSRPGRTMARRSLCSHVHAVS